MQVTFGVQICVLLARLVGLSLEMFGRCRAVIDMEPNSWIKPDDDISLLLRIIGMQAALMSQEVLISSRFLLSPYYSNSLSQRLKTLTVRQG